MLFNCAELDLTELGVIDSINKLRESLSYAVGTPRKWTGLLRRNLFARAIRGSNSIEGYQVSVDDAVAAIEGKEPMDAEYEAWQAVTGYRSAMSYVLQLSDDPYFSYSSDLLRALHYMMIQHDLSKHPGKWRPGPIYVRNEEHGEIVYEGPEAEKVPALIQEMVTSLSDQKPMNPLIRAAMGHLNLVMIHPFSDGNGRMGRCLQTLILARDRILGAMFCSIEEYLGRNTEDYYSVLAEVGGGRWSPGRDARPWIRFCLTAHYRQVTTVLRRTKEMNRLWDAVELEVQKLRLPSRVIPALVDAAIGFRIRNATYRVGADVSEPVAGRDLKSLADLGLIVGNGERRGRFYLASKTLQKIRETTREPRIPVPDPFGKSDTKASSLAPPTAPSGPTTTSGFTPAVDHPPLNPAEARRMAALVVQRGKQDE
jgi:Fic family protein